MKEIKEKELQDKTNVDEIENLVEEVTETEEEVTKEVTETEEEVTKEVTETEGEVTEEVTEAEEEVTEEVSEYEEDIKKSSSKIITVILALVLVVLIAASVWSIDNKNKLTDIDSDVDEMNSLVEEYQNLLSKDFIIQTTSGDVDYYISNDAENGVFTYMVGDFEYSVKHENSDATIITLLGYNMEVDGFLRISNFEKEDQDAFREELQRYIGAIQTINDYEVTEKGYLIKLDQNTIEMYREEGSIFYVIEQSKPNGDLEFELLIELGGDENEE